MMNSNTYRSSVNLPEVVKVIDNENYTTILRNKGLCELTYKSKGIITLDVAKELTKEILDFSSHVGATDLTNIQIFMQNAIA